MGWLPSRPGGLIVAARATLPSLSQVSKMELIIIGGSCNHNVPHEPSVIPRSLHDGSGPRWFPEREWWREFPRPLFPSSKQTKATSSGIAAPTSESLTELERLRSRFNVLD